MKSLFLVRHCRSIGQEPDAPLADDGLAQAERLAAFLSDRGVRRVVASPFVRAYQSAEPLARRLGLPVETDDRLRERRLGMEWVDDWLARLERSFDDLDLCFDGGESNRAAMARGVAAVADALERAVPAVLVTHGNLLTTILRHADGRSGFAEWRALANPDVFHLSATGSAWSIERIWR